MQASTSEQKHQWVSELARLIKHNSPTPLPLTDTNNLKTCKFIKCSGPKMRNESSSRMKKYLLKRRKSTDESELHNHRLSVQRTCDTNEATCSKSVSSDFKF
jgi:hypothetical protein